MKLHIFTIFFLLPAVLSAESGVTNERILQELQKLADRVEALEKKLGPAAPSANPLTDPERRIFGMSLTRGPYGNRISRVFGGGPADRAGLKPRDLLLQLDGLDVTSFATQDLLAKLDSKDSFVFTVLTSTDETREVEVEKMRQGDFMLASGGFRISGEIPGLTELRVGDPAPDFTTTKSDGEQIRLTDLSNKVVLVNFTSTWCGPCKEELPGLLKVYEEKRDRGFEILSVFLDHDAEAVERYVAENQIPWPVYAGESGWDTPIAREYGISGIPRNALIVDGKIAEENLRGDQIASGIARYLQ